MELKQRESGLVVPVERSDSSTGRVLTPLEIVDPENRAKALRALDLLWEAMELKRGGVSASYEAHDQAFWYLSRMLLGPDSRDREVYC